MANRTDPVAKSIRGTNPHNLVEEITRSKIYQNNYWKEQCFGLTAETLVEKAMELNHIGGTYGGNKKPTPFMCLVLKMLQIQPEKDIDVRVLGAFYLRLTGTDTDVYRYLEPLCNDYRKLKQKSPDGNFRLTHVDEVIDELLTRDFSFDIALPRIKKRWTLEPLGALDPKKSVLEDDFEEEENEENEQDVLEDEPVYDKDYYRAIPARERDRDRRHDSYRYREAKAYGGIGEGDFASAEDQAPTFRLSSKGIRVMTEIETMIWNGDVAKIEFGTKTGIMDYYRLREEKEYGFERKQDREREGRKRYRRDTDSGRRSPSRSRDHKRHARDSNGPRRHESEVGSSALEETKQKKEKKDDGSDHPDPEIAEANRIRASLGLKPLKL
ncbi:hypothetical protein REPUB_Repub13aG0147200 [Reevesia pubescens]